MDRIGLSSLERWWPAAKLRLLGTILHGLVKLLACSKSPVCRLGTVNAVLRKPLHHHSNNIYRLFTIMITPDMQCLAATLKAITQSTSQPAVEIHSCVHSLPRFPRASIHGCPYPCHLKVIKRCIIYERESFFWKPPVHYCPSISSRLRVFTPRHCLWMSSMSARASPRGINCYTPSVVPTFRVWF